KLSNRAISWFKEGDGEVKRLILEIVSSNLALKDKKLLIETKKPFSQGPKLSASSSLRGLVEDVRTLRFTIDFSMQIFQIKKLFEMVEKKSSQRKPSPKQTQSLWDLMRRSNGDLREAA